MNTALTRNLLHALRNAEVAAWSEIAADDVFLSCSAGYGVRGREGLKAWAVGVARALRCAIDLTDEHLAVDSQGNGRGFVTLTLHCKMDHEVTIMAERDCEWTSSETLLLTVEAYRLVRIYIAGETFDLALRCMRSLVSHSLTTRAACSDRHE